MNMEEYQLQILRPDGKIADMERLESLALSARELLEIYRRMILVRMLHLEGERRAHWNHMTLFIGPMGQEAAEIASAMALTQENQAFVYGRSWGVAIGKGVKPKSVFDGFFGSPDKNSIKDFIEQGVHLPYISVGIQIPHAVGAAFAEKTISRKNIPTIVYFGDGATAQGFFHSGMNWASVFKIPTIFFCENNQYAISTPPYLQTATKTFAERALGYNMNSMRIDGNDPLAVLWATREALQLAINEGKPTLIEAVTYRLCDHTTAVGKICKIPQDEEERGQFNDPLRRMQKFLLSDEAKKLYGIEWPAEDETPDSVDTLYQQTNVESNKADKHLFVSAYREVKEAARTSYEEFQEAHKKGRDLVLITEEWHRTPRVGEHYRKLSGFSLKKVSGIAAREAIGLALYDAMRFDPTIVYLGEDVGKVGGVLRSTALREDLAAEERFVREQLPDWKERILHKYLPLQTLFPKRVIDTPLDEAGIIGIGLGLSLNGVRPVIEIQFDGFTEIGAAQIEEFSRIIHRYAGLKNAPGVIFLPYGGGERIEYHRGAPRFTGNPGLIVACPSSVQDFYDMLWASIASDKPVVFFAHIDLYREPKAVELVRRPPSKPVEEFGIRKVLEGSDVTIVSYGRMVHECVKALELVRAKEKDFSADLLDLRVMSPLDKETLLASATKTGRVVIVQEEPASYGVSSEIARVISGELKSFERLRAPIQTVSAPHTHFPPSKFWPYYIPQPEDIAEKILEAINL